MEIDVPASIIKALVVAFPPPQLPTLFAEAVAAKPFTWVVPEEIEFDDAFVNLALG